LPVDHVPVHHRYTVDTEEDLALAKEIAARIGHPPPVTLGELERIVGAEPDLTGINADVRQKPWWEYEQPVGGTD
jgi:spore coat polysaccharide biosynthesis protein SpsF (cytidylyltransferase family)